MPASKIIHVPIELNLTPSKDIWVFEKNQEKIASQEIRQILKSSEEFGDDDLIIFADIDEMISREVLHSLRHCELRHGVLDGAIIMPIGNFDLATSLHKECQWKKNATLTFSMDLTTKWSLNDGKISPNFWEWGLF